jgi:hypothetical protein
MQKNAVSVLGVSEVRWKGQGEIRNRDYTVFYSGGDKAERGIAIVVHKITVKSVVKKSVYGDRIIAVKLKAELVSILTVQVYMPTLEYEGDEVKLKKFLKRIERVQQIRYNGRLEQCGWR